MNRRFTFVGLIMLLTALLFSASSTSAQQPGPDKPDGGSSSGLTATAAGPAASPSNSGAYLTVAAAPAGITFHSWYQGLRPTAMIPVSRGLCFLQGVAGKFRGAGERVFIYNSGGYWLLSGTSQQKGVSARAMCVPFNAIRGAHSFTYTVQPAWVWVRAGSCGIWACGIAAERELHLNDTSNFCYLTGMGGKFNGLRERVSMPIRGGRWRLNVLTGVERGYLRGEAGCIKINGRSNPRMTSIYHPYEWQSGKIYQRLPDADQAFCALNTIQGKFDHEGQSIQIFRFGRQQYLGGSSRQQAIAKASCFYYNQV
jgi:hypothetical protein